MKRWTRRITSPGATVASRTRGITSRCRCSCRSVPIRSGAAGKRFVSNAARPAQQRPGSRLGRDGLRASGSSGGEARLCWRRAYSCRRWVRQCNGAFSTAEDAEDAKDRFGNHPDEPLRHDIQNRGCERKRSETTETARSDRDSDGRLAGPSKKGSGLARSLRPRGRSPSMTARCPPPARSLPHPPDPMVPAVSVHTLASGWLLKQCSASSAVKIPLPLDRRRKQTGHVRRRAPTCYPDL